MLLHNADQRRITCSAPTHRKQCGHSVCTKQSYFGKKAALCAEHVQDGMVDQVTRGVATAGGCTQSSFGNLDRTNKASLCAQHAEDGMVNFRTKRCGHSGWVHQGAVVRQGPVHPERRSAVLNTENTGWWTSVSRG